ncbi:MAG: hypothetical protein ABJN24_00550 [Hyphomicrobiales bacterium]
MALIRNFPLLILPLLIYNAFSLGIISTLGEIWSGEIFRFDMISGATFSLTRGGMIVTIALSLLFIEILKATRTARSTIIDHLLSTLVFIIYLIQFIVDPAAATTTYFICLMVALLDVIAGYSISIRVASRDVTLGS